MAAISDTVVRKVERVWDDPAQRRKVLRALEEYGRDDPDDPAGSERVQLAILKLSNRLAHRVVELVSEARRDFRDVLLWAENPRESQAVWAVRSNLTPEEHARLEEIRRRDRDDYEEWLKQ